MKGKSDAYKKLLEKLGDVDMSTGGNFWKPPEGLSTIRILPPVGKMDYFFLEVGQHYINNTSLMCPNICSEGELPCPLCEVNELLFRSGEKEMADRYRVSRSFWMNIIVRGEESSGAQKFTPGVTIFRSLASYISDPDYGDITDEGEGFDVKITRKGQGINTRYETRCARNPSPLSEDDDQIEEWLEKATDIAEFVAGQMLSYDDLAEQTGVDVFLEQGDVSTLDVEESEPDEIEDDEDESPSARIEKRLARRTGRRSGSGRQRTS